MAVSATTEGGGLKEEEEGDTDYNEQEGEAVEADGYGGCAEEHSEEDDDEEDEDGEEQDVGANQGDTSAALAGDRGGEDFEVLKGAALQALLAHGQPMTTGRVGYAVGAKKRPVAAALFALASEAAIERIDGVPPRWAALTSGQAVGQGAVPHAPSRFAYEPKALRAGVPRPSFADFEALKQLVRSRLATMGEAGTTAGALGYQLGATRKAVNAALYACQREGTAWPLEAAAGVAKVRWAGIEPEAEPPLPAAYAHTAGACGERAAVAALKRGAQQVEPERAGGTSASASKRPRLTMASPPLDDFEVLKLIVRSRLQAKGAAGMTSGALGYELSAMRKAVTAALYSCAQEGTVYDAAEGSGKPRWACAIPPPASAGSCSLPGRFAYQGRGEEEEGEEAASAAASEAAPPKGPPPAWLLAQAKAQAQLVPLSRGPAAKAAAQNPVSQLCEWAQKGRHMVALTDMGQESLGGPFVCQVTLGGEALARGSAPNKKEAKRLAAVAALQQLGL